MSSPLVYPVILSGGAGTRLWPVSRALHPKQLLPLVTDRTLIQDTGLRASGDGFGDPLVVCNEAHRFAIAEQLRAAGIAPGRIIVEPAARNTAPAIVAAGLCLAETDPDALLLVLPSDHAVRDVESFRAAVKVAAAAALTGKLVTFGMTPDKPHTGYGYIRSGGPLGSVPGAFEVERFVEKPNLETAKEFLADGGWSWNAGMFLFPVKLLLDEMRIHQPEILAKVTAAHAAAVHESDFVKLEKEAFGAAPSISIDYALMEPTKHAAVVPASLGWSDVGAWSALWEVGEQDDGGNVTVGDVLTHDVTNSYLRSDGPLLTAVGLDEMVAVATHDAVLIAPRHRSEDVKVLVSELTKQGRDEAVMHPTVHRPWGTYRSLIVADGYQVKHITVKPGGRLSLQKHAHRAEHWTVVAGVARVTCGDKVHALKANESVAIPLGAVHRLENLGTETVHLIEVQCGGYLGEDDIVRLEDVYGRV